jgi:hypothetical protein
MLSPRADNWIDFAAAHGSTKWLKQFIRTYLPQLQQGTIAPQDLAQALADEFETRNLKSLSQQKNYRSNVVQALKVLDEYHPAIALISPSPQQYRQLNDAQRGKLAERETKYFTSAQADALVNQATALLDSSEWSEVGAALAVLIGRRISEILLSDFSLKSHWSLGFTGMAKKSEGCDRLTIEIPTLAPAQKVLSSIQKLQQSLKIEDLKLTSLSSKLAKQKVNQRFSGAIAVKCDQHFGDLVPTRHDKDNLYTHIFRAVYATIATHWFCPPQVPEHAFKAEIQGHFTIAADGTKLPNFSARANYDDYAIGDGQGNRDGRLGTKLGTLPDLQVIEAFRKPQSGAVSQPAFMDPLTTIETSDSRQDQEIDRSLSPVMEATNRNVAEADGDRLSLSDTIPAQSIPIALDKPTANALRYRAASLLANTNASAAQRSVALQILTGLSLSQLLEAHIQAIDPFHLSVDGAQVKTLVQQLFPHIHKLRQSPCPTPDEMHQVWHNTFDDLSLQDQTLSQLYAQLQDQPLQETAPMSTPSKPKVKRPDLLAQDLERMFALMAQLGIGGNSAEVFHALLNAFEQGQVFQQQQHTQTIQEVAQTLNWFTSEIEQLRSQLKALEQERDQLKGDRSSTEDLARLQAENQQLRAELNQTRSRLEGIQNLLGGTQGQQPAPISTIDPQPVIAPTPPATNGEQTDTRRSPQPKSAQAPTRRGGQDTITKINQIVDALIRWNSNQQDAQQQLRISIPIIKELASLIGANYQPAIQQVLKDREQELDNHHSQFMLGFRHNASVFQKDEILKRIASQFLQLD